MTALELARANHLAMPVAAAWVAEMRELFGEIKVVHVKENGHEIGKPGPAGVQAVQK